MYCGTPVDSANGGGISVSNLNILECELDMHVGIFGNIKYLIIIILYFLILTVDNNRSEKSYNRKQGINFCPS